MKKQKNVIRENIEAVIFAILLAIFIRTFAVQAFKIPSGSMEQTLLIGDYILVNKFIYGIKIPFTNTKILPFKTPQYNDVIVFKFPKDPSKNYIKRVVGLPGDTIEIRNKQLFVNNLLMQNSYIKKNTTHSTKIKTTNDEFRGPIVVPRDQFFVMGDNRDFSYDSRSWGCVNINAVRGEAFMIYWSWNNKNSSIRFDRIGQHIK